MHEGEFTDRHQRERGAATLETTGVTMIAAALVVGLILAATPQAQRVAETFSYYVCQVVTFGQGGCTPPTALADAHKPTEPCVLAQDGVERDQKVAVIVFTVSDGRRIEVQQLSNGEYRVTVTDTGGAGAEVGVGGGLSVTVNDTTVGGNVSASAGASLDIAAGDVYYADEDSIGDLMDALTQDQVKDAVAGDNGPIRWVTDQVTDLAGVSNDLPDADETYAEGGISLNASAEATGVGTSASAGVEAAQMLGVRTDHRDGSTTIYLSSTVSGEAGVSQFSFDGNGSPQTQGAGLEGEMQMVTAVTFDSEGNMVNVQATASAGGSSSGIAAALFGGEVDGDMSNQVSNTRIWQATLPINSAADAATASQFLLTQGVSSLGAWANPAVSAAAGGAGIYTSMNFFDAVRNHGVLTQQDYDTDSNTVFGLDASGELGVQLGVAASVQEDSMTITSAEYWDGSQWTNWEACGT